MLVRNITSEQKHHLIEMSKYFYEDNIEVFWDPDNCNSIVYANTVGKVYHSIGWFQVCIDLILPKVVELRLNSASTGFVDENDIKISFMRDLIIENAHPVDLLYSLFAVLIDRDDGTNNGREEQTSQNKTG